MTTRLTLICHASTAATRASAFPADEPIEPRARAQLGRAPGLTLRADRFETSPALRAIQTAEALNLASEVEPRLRDCDFGRWSGRALEEVQREEPEALLQWLRDPGAAPHGGESVLDLIDRVAGWLDMQRANPGRLVAVTHASVMRAAIVHALEAGPRAFWRIDIAPLAQVRLSAADGRWTLRALSPLAANPEDG